MVDLEEFESHFRAFLANDTEFHFSLLGISMEECKRGWVKLGLDYRDEFVGDPEIGAVHGGVITALLDTCSGLAVGSTRDRIGLGPTIDLRIDYMRPSQPGKRIYGEADVYRITPHIVFTRGVAYQDDREKPIAHSVANFTIIPEKTPVTTSPHKPSVED